METPVQQLISVNGVTSKTSKDSGATEQAPASIIINLIAHHAHLKLHAQSATPHTPLDAVHVLQIHSQLSPQSLETKSPGMSPNAPNVQ